MHESKENNSSRLDKEFNKKLQDLYTNLNFEDKVCFDTEPTTVFQGGLGHPLKVYNVGTLNVIMKDATNGAWYGECCEDCGLHPCHDALMALRVLPGNSLQLCLMNEDNIYSFTNNEEEDRKQFQRCLKIYDNAKFKGEK